MSRFSKWALFFTICAMMWICALAFIFLSGSTSCELAGSCVRDRIVSILILLMLPSQAAAAAYLRHNERGEW